MTKYESPRIRCVGTVADMTLAQGVVGHDDQWTLTVVLNGVTSTYGGTFGGGLS